MNVQLGKRAVLIHSDICILHLRSILSKVKLSSVILNQFYPYYPPITLNTNFLVLILAYGSSIF